MRSKQSSPFGGCFALERSVSRTYFLDLVVLRSGATVGRTYTHTVCCAPAFAYGLKKCAILWARITPPVRGPAHLLSSMLKQWTFCKNVKVKNLCNSGGCWHRCGEKESSRRASESERVCECCLFESSQEKSSSQFA